MSVKKPTHAYTCGWTQVVTPHSYVSFLSFCLLIQDNIIILMVEYRFRGSKHTESRIRGSVGNRKR
jgi:hypothetical protein